MGATHDMKTRLAYGAIAIVLALLVRPATSGQRGIPKVLLDDSTYCPQWGRSYRVRNLTVQLAPEKFGKEQLLSLIHQYEPSGTPYDEVKMLILSDAREANILLEAYVDNDAAIARRRKLTEEFLHKTTIVAEYHRVKHDAALWFSTPAGVTGPIIVEGRDPYDETDAPFPFCVIQNEVQMGWDNGHCFRRRIVVLVCPQNYEKEKVISLWRFLDNRFPAPDELEVEVRANRSELQQEVMGERTLMGIYPFVLRANSFAERCHGGNGSGRALLIRNSKERRYSFTDTHGQGGEWQKMPEQ